MNCSNCGQPTAPDDVFCATCGADLGAQRAALVAEPAAPAVAAPTAVQPTAPTQPMAPPPPPPAAPVAAAAPSAPATPAADPDSAPPKKSRALMITLIVLGVLLLLCSCAGVGGYLLYMPIRSEIKEVTTPEPPVSDEATAPGGALSTQSYTTPEEAVKAELPADWVFKKVEDGADRVVFWAGPPNSEFTTIYVVDVQSDKQWRVTESSPLEAGGDVAPADEAAATVEQFLTLVQADKGLEAQRLTVPPFSEDPASAAVSNGQFISFSIDAVESAGDETFLVTTTEVWKNGTDRWTYRVVRTGEGMLIQELLPATQ